MTSPTSSALRPTLPLGRGMDSAIAGVAVAGIALAVMHPGLLVAALGAGLTLIAVLNVDLFVCAMVFFLPWYPFLQWKFRLHDVFLPSRFIIFAVVAVLQRRKGISWRRWLWEDGPRKGALFFAAVAVLSLLVSDYRSNVDCYPSLGKQLSYIAMFFGIAGWADTRKKIARILKIVLYSTVIVAVFGLYQAFAGSFTALFFRLYPQMEAVYDAQGGWAGRITSFLFHYNSLAGYLNVVAPLALGAAVVAKGRWMRWLGFICLCLSLAAVYLTGSRGGLIACGATALMSIWYLTPRRKTMAVLLISTILAAVMAIPLSARAGLETGRVQNLDAFTVETRLALWGAAGAIFLHHPLLGGGMGAYRFRFHEYIPGIADDLDSHNLYLQTLAEVGIAGFLAFFATMWGVFRRSLALMRSQDALWRMVGIGVAGGLAATMVHGSVDYIFLVSPQFGGLFWMMLGLGLAAYEQFREMKEGRRDGDR